MLKVKTEKLFSKKTDSTATIVDDEVIYKLYADYNEKDKTFMLNMSFGNNAKDENGEYVSEGEHNIIYQFKVLNDKKLVLARIDIAG